MQSPPRGLPRGSRPAIRKLAALVALLLAVPLVAACGGAIDAFGLQQQAKSVRSATEEGVLIAQGAAQARATAAFVEIHAKELTKSLTTARMAVSSTVSHGLRREAAQLAKLAGAASLQLSRLAVDPHDRLRAALVRERLQRIARTAGRMAEP